ncbi:hypothetical protein TNCT_242471 [Trichonephila clavata]|uniref:Uncharacterized protein n=1 Tax=Trichonephila clavata TaxID=2740835 RepID=A0A8X6KSF6_TRICU|nr:hypothetical protein TNCT_242471 [Trichonephila clavata]
MSSRIKESVKGRRKNPPQEWLPSQRLESDSSRFITPTSIQFMESSLPYRLQKDSSSHIPLSVVSQSTRCGGLQNNQECTFPVSPV